MAVQLLAVILPVAATLVGRYFQDRNEKISREADRLKVLIPKVNAVVDQITSQVNLLSYYSDETLFSLVFRKQNYECHQSMMKKNLDVNDLSPEWSNYSKAKVKWEGAQAINLAFVQQYFKHFKFVDPEDGPLAIEELLKNIREDFIHIDNMLKATYYGREESRYFLIDKITDGVCETAKRSKSTAKTGTKSSKSAGKTSRKKTTEENDFRSKYMGKVKAPLEKRIQSLNNAMVAAAKEICKL